MIPGKYSRKSAAPKYKMLIKAEIEWLAYSKQL
jgi:hypothetical protein